MTLSATSTALGVSLAASAGSVDPFGLARWAAIAQALDSWFPASVTFTSVGLTGAAGNVTGTTPFVFSASDLGEQLADAAQSVDAAGQAAWGRIGDAIIVHCTSYGQGNGAGMAYAVAGTGTPVPVTGTGAIQFSDTALLGPAMADAAGSVDAVGLAAWQSIASQILTWLAAGQFMPTTSGAPSMFCPDTGGPVTGAGELL